MKRIVLASGNPGKLREIRELVNGIDVEIVPQSDFTVPEIEETGLSFAENAILKARHAATHAKLPAIADDSGIEVDILGGAPGIYSARYAGAGASDDENLRLLIENVRATGEQRAIARFLCVMVYMHSADDAMPIIARGSWEGYLVDEPRGVNGFGYDPIFYVPSHRCTSAELPPEIKNRISHRGRALQKLIKELKTRIK